MHKCINNSENDVSHLEQVTNEFFPYSRDQLGFDKPVTIIFQSDPENSSKMLGKTAFYNPESLEVVLYTDNRHPKDIMRSLSHELVHHAQNCRGDFTGDSQTVDGYAQSDPHLRSMEREAYTKGNLIFRDFEDLIKTGKINIEIDFSRSGEPEMSLKEWKNNEINTKLMKKWGFLKESKEVTAENTDELDEGHVHSEGCGCPDQELEEGFGWRAEDDEVDESYIDFAKSRGQLHKTLSVDDLGIGSKSHNDEEGNRDAEDDEILGQPHRGQAPSRRSRSARSLGGRHPVVQEKISVREAKQITRRIIERIKKEGK